MSYAMTMPQAKRARAIYETGRYAWRNRKAVGRAARTIQRFARRRYKKSKMAKRSTPSKSRQSSKARTDTEGGGTIGIAMGELYSDMFEYPDITGGNTGGIGRRLVNTTLLKGYKVCRQFSYKPDVPDIGPIEVHYAIVQAKSNCVDTDFGTTVLSEFWRSFLSNDDKMRDFDGYAPSGVQSNWSHHFNCLAINPDNAINIITHRRKIIHFPTPEAIASGRDVWNIRKYHKINMRIVFEKADSPFPQRPHYEIWWYNTINGNKFPTDPKAIEYISTLKTNTCYFKDMLG